MFDYTLIDKAYILSDDENAEVIAHPPSLAADWGHNGYDGIKQNLKKHLIVEQFDRCAYCRKIVEVDAYYEPLEHIVPKSKKPQWLIHPKNLIVTCDRCNNLKGDTQTLADGYIDSDDIPEVSDAYKIFNPYYDTWSHHFTIENEMFLTPVNGSKGKETMNVCKLRKYHVSVNIAKEHRLGQKKPIGRAIERLTNLDKDSESYDEIFSELLNLINHYKDRMNENPNFL